MRVADWEAKLVDAITDGLTRPFEWGKFDCVVFAADVACAISDIEDPIADIRERYHDAMGARILLRLRHEMREAVSDKLGLPMVNMLFARAGDIVLTRRKALGVVVADKAAVPGRYGLEFVPIADWECAWGIR